LTFKLCIIPSILINPPFDKVFALSDTHLIKASGFSFLSIYVKKLSGDFSYILVALLSINPVMIDGLSLLVSRSKMIYLNEIENTPPFKNKSILLFEITSAEFNLDNVKLDLAPNVSIKYSID
jgi:hypothetical protein